jgi:GT2 family glycosyltransferase
LVFVDDDIEAGPRWLDRLLEAARSESGYEVFGGPITPRLEGAAARGCGREPAPITALDLGPADRPAEFVWSANMAVRRSAVERVGEFDETISGRGDEEDWQRRLADAGGRALYVAGAEVVHRRAGSDARLPALCRANFFLGRSARRYDVRKHTEPSLGAELRVLAGCIWHTLRRRCAFGIVMAAHTLGRLRELVAER